MLSTRMNRWTFAAITLAALAAPAAVSAQTPEHTADNAAQFPSKADLKSLTTSGSYLAARHASVERGRLKISYNGKHGIRRTVTVTDSGSLATLQSTTAIVNPRRVPIRSMTRPASSTTRAE